MPEQIILKFQISSMYTTQLANKAQRSRPTAAGTPTRCGLVDRVLCVNLVAERANQSHVIVRVATLNEDPGIIPASHIWTSHDVPWLKYEGIPAYSKWQPNRA